MTEINEFTEVVRTKDANALRQILVNTPFWRRLTGSESGAPEVYVDLEQRFLQALVQSMIEQSERDILPLQRMFARIRHSTWGPKIAMWMQEACFNVIDPKSRGAPQQIVHALNNAPLPKINALVLSLGADVGQDVEKFKEMLQKSLYNLIKNEG